MTSYIENVKKNVAGQGIVYQVGYSQSPEEEHVYDIFQEMMTAIVKDVPKDPIAYLINKMENPDCK